MSEPEKNKGGRPVGSINKRSRGVLAVLKREYDLDPLLKMAETCMMQTPLLDSGGAPVMGTDDQPIMVPFLKPNELVTALGKLMDKTYPTLKAQELDMKNDGLAVVHMNMVGLGPEGDSEAEPPPKPKRKPRAKKVE